MQGWTEDEDFYLSQGYAIFPSDFEKIKQYFPFREGRTASDLSDRWRELNDQLESEGLEKLKQPDVKPHRQTWTYRFEPQIETPDVEEMIEQYRRMPSLSMKTQSAEVRSTKFEHDEQNINEMCLNHQFDANSVRQIVQGGLQRIVDDEILRETLITEFMEGLAVKGREFVVQDFGRKLRIINDMEPSQADTEVKILAEQLKRIFNVIMERAKFPQGAALLAMMMQLQKIEWPPKMSQPVERLKNQFRQIYLHASAQLLNGFQYRIDQWWVQFMKSLVVMDVNQELDQFLTNPRMKKEYMDIRQGKHQ